MMTAADRHGRSSPKQPSMVLLAVIAMLGTLGMHILVPALPGMASDFHTTPATMQLAITAYMIGLAAGQIFYGPVSDRFGRRPVLLAGLVLYIIGMALALPMMSIGFLLFARVLQALGACGAFVLGRAMVRDGATPESAAGRMAVLTMAMTISPAIAPGVGYLIASSFGWHAIFLLLFAVGVLLFLLCWALLPETNLHRVSSLGIGGMVRNYGKLFGSRSFMGYTLGGSTIIISSYVFLGALPHLVTDVLGRPAAEATYGYAAIVLGMTLGAYVAKRLSRRLAPLAGVKAGPMVAIIGAVLLLLASLNAPGFLSMVLPVVIYSIGAGMISPNAISGAMGRDPTMFGATSSLYGVIQMGWGAFITAVPSMIGSQSPLTVATILSICALAGIGMLCQIPRQS